LKEPNRLDGVIDSHCHLDFKNFNKDREEVIFRARDAGVAVIINSGVDRSTNETTLELARKYDFIYPTLGLSPNVLDGLSETDLQSMLDHIQTHANEIIGVGEAGLDYYRCTDTGKRKHQASVFQRVIDLAESQQLPLVIHSRQAEQDAFEMVRHLEKVVFHCYGGTLATMKDILDRGFYISLATNLVRSGHHKVLARQIPLESLLIETDSPFLSPRRGRNEPGYILDSVGLIANLKDVSPTDVAKITARNARDIYSL
jgi:TatD DNase family protein